MHLPALANLSSLATIIAGYNTNLSIIYPYFGFYFHLFSYQSRDKMLQIILRFVLYPTMMVANHGQINWPMLASAYFLLCFFTFYSNAGKCMFSTLFILTFHNNDQSLLPFFKSFLNYSYMFTFYSLAIVIAGKIYSYLRGRHF